MNEKKNFDKDLLQLGLPPMELAERSTNEQSNTGIRKYVHPMLQKVIAILLITLLAVGSYVVLLTVVQSFDTNYSTEIIFVSGLRESPNITIDDENLEIFLQVLNQTSQTSSQRVKRSSSDNKTDSEFENPDHFNDSEIKKAREIIMNHNVLCKSENKNQICKDIVSKLKLIKENNQLAPEDVDDSLDMKTNNLEETNKIIDEQEEITSTDKLKRETQPMMTKIDLLKSTPNHPIQGKSILPVENHSVNLHSYPHPQQSSRHLVDTCLLARLLKRNYPNLQDVYDAPAVDYEYHPSFPQGREADAPKHTIHPQDAEIFMKYLKQWSDHPSTEKPNNTSRRDSECPVGTIPCDNGDNCIEEKQMCDGIVDCSDVSDETKCSCKSRVDKSRLCDGYFDCPFGEDEMGCHGCSETSFSCDDLDMNSRSTCFTKEERCNNIANCPNQRDEMECTMLAPSLHKEPIFAVSNTEGFLHRNFKGNWFAVCKNPYMWAHDVCRRETGLIIRPPFIQIVQIDPLLKVNYLNTGPGGQIHVSSTCFNSSAVYVTCPDLLCGTRVLTNSQILRENAAVENHLFGRNKRYLFKNQPYPLMFYKKRTRRHIGNVADVERKPIGNPSTVFDMKSDEPLRNKRTESRVVGGKPSQPSSWPWMVGMYRDGMFHCGGVILTPSWIMSAAHCVHKFWEHYFEIQVGMLRRFSFSPQEQNHRVTHVIVNQHYNQKDMKNDLSLLKVQPSIQFSRWVRPICLPGPETAGADWLMGPAPGTMCTAVGWGATVEHGPDPDHLREVEVPIWSRCKHREDEAGREICAGLVEGGKDACQGDSGGPLLCRNPLNPRQWYMAGIVSHGDGCARKGEPGVYTRVSLFVKWIRYHVFSKSLPTIQPKQECPGFKCISGITKCIPNKRMCDKIVDCLDAEDEINCNSLRLNPFGDSVFSSTLTRDANSNQNHQTKEAELKPEQDVFNKKVIGNFDTFTTQVKAKYLLPATTTELHKTREAMDLILSKELEDYSNSDDKLRQSDTKTDSSTQNNIFSITNVTQPFLNSKSEEDSNDSSSEELATVDPIRSTTNEDVEKRGDIQFVTSLSRESLEARSSIMDRDNYKEADIHEDWSDSTTEISTTLNGSTEQDPSSKDNLIATKTLPESLSNGPSNNISSSKPDNTSKGSHLSTLIDSDSEPQSKDFLLDIIPTTQPTLHTNNNLHSESSDHDTISTTSSETPAAKILDFDIKNELVDKIKDIVSFKLQPAKLGKKHRIPKEFECRRIYQSIPYHRRCNHKADCEDGTDELGCTCNDYLFTFDRKLLCDGFFDCSDGQDEINCYHCHEEQFLCKRSQLCLPSKYVCDGKPQCPQGEDELDCFALSNGKNIIYDMDDRPKISLEGYLTKKHVNDWHIVCEDNMSIENQELAASHICRYLGFSSANKYLVKYINVKEDEIIKARVDDRRNRRELTEVPIRFAYRNAEQDSARHIVIKEPQFLKEQCVPNVTKTCMSLYVYCDHSLFSDFDITQEFLYSRMAESPTQRWPWVAKVYVEGKYKCSGVLIHVSWVLVSHSCLWDSLLNHHVLVVLGSHRTLNSTQGMYEQIYRVDSKKDLYRSRATALHLKQSAQYSNMVKPMVLPATNMQDLKPNMCVAIGEGPENNTIGVFVEESSENCDVHSRCYVRLQKEKNCAPGITTNRRWAGIISCHDTEHGWYPVASFVENSGECGMGDRIIGTEIGHLKNEMKNEIKKFYIGASSESEIESNEEDNCEGQRCGRGECVKLAYVCDGIHHCNDGMDELEAACTHKHQICSKEPYHRGCECSSGQLKCRNGRCVAKELYRNGRDDCGDGTDEPDHATCYQYLARVNPARLCDGVLHCKDKTDEDPMFCKCHAENTYKCHRSSADHCVPPDMVCDGEQDCPNGDDEIACMGLSAPEGTPYGTGQVIVRSHGVWHSKCYPTQNHTKSELEAICRELGFISGHAKQISPPNGVIHPYNNLAIEPYTDIQLNSKTRLILRNSDAPIATAIKDHTLENCNPVFIECL